MGTMKGLAAALACGLALALAGCASAGGGRDRPFSPALYVVRDADSRLYLFGTVHVRPADAPWGGANAERALADAQEVWTELDMSPAAEADVREAVAELGVAAPGRPLSSWLAQADKARLDALTARLGLGQSALEQLQPWLAAITLSMTPIVQAGYDPQSGVDRRIDAAARAAGKSMRALETPRQQLGLFAALSDAAQRQMLRDAIEEAEAGPAQLAGLSAAWERGDLATIEAVVVDDMRRDYPELFETLFTRRNSVWADVLEAELKRSGVDFVAVGAGHLVGDEGLVSLLRARGYRVARVSPAR